MDLLVYVTGVGAPFAAARPAAGAGAVPACGYDLSGTPAGPCPECGHARSTARSEHRPAALLTCTQARSGMNEATS